MPNLQLDEVAARLCCSRYAVRRLIKRKALRGIQIGGGNRPRYIVAVEDLEDFERTNRTVPAKPVSRRRPKQEVPNYYGYL
jgi:hypothetical protein